MRFFKNPKIVLAITLLVVIPFIIFNLLPKNNILGTNTHQLPSPEPTPTLRSSSTIEESSPPPTKLSKSTYKIALFGDSMVDTMGDMKFLNEFLVKKYPGTSFVLYNYGIGSQNAQEATARFSLPFSYQNRNYPPIGEIGADVIILGSFAYNPFSPHDKNKHYLRLYDLAIASKKAAPQVYLLAEIAPLKVGFGKGPQGPNWDEKISYDHTLKIINNLENVFALGKTLNLPVLDVYHETIDKDKWGRALYVSLDDGLHPSYDGHMFTASVISRKIELK